MRCATCCNPVPVILPQPRKTRVVSCVRWATHSNPVSVILTQPRGKTSVASCVSWATCCNPVSATSSQPLMSSWHTHANRPTTAATQSPMHSGRMRSTFPTLYSFSRTLGPYTS